MCQNRVKVTHTHCVDKMQSFLMFQQVVGPHNQKCTLKGAATHSSCVMNHSVLLQLPSKTLEYGVGGEDSLPTRKGSVILDEVEKIT